MMRYDVLRHPGRFLVAATALTSLLFPGQVALADDGDGEDLVAVVANTGSDCVQAGDDFAEQVDLPLGAEVFFGCVDGVVTVNAFDEAYAPVIDPVSDVTRTTTDTGKYSIIFNAMYVKESSVPVEIAILGDPTGPRFPCYAKSQKKNCEWPNGKEAGVF